MQPAATGTPCGDQWPGKRPWMHGCKPRRADSVSRNAATQRATELLHTAQHLILAEGSAIHALELIGRQPNKTVTVIARRPLWQGMDRPLRSRFPQLRWIDAVQALHWLPPANPRVKGVAQLDWKHLTAELNERFGWKATTVDIKEFEDAANQQLAHLHQTLPLQTHRCTANDRRPLRAGGW